jgi:hypothetical protein
MMKISEIEYSVEKVWYCHIFDEDRTSVFVKRKRFLQLL